MDNNELPSLFYWTYYHDGTVETNFTPDLKPARIQKEPLEEPSPEIPPQTSTEHPQFDYDKLIAESDWPSS